jgi:hypothetical protein
MIHPRIPPLRNTTLAEEREDRVYQYPELQAPACPHFKGEEIDQTQ